MGERFSQKNEKKKRISLNKKRDDMLLAYVC